MNTPRLILATSITAFLALSAAPSVQAVVSTQYWNPGGTGTITTVTAGSGTWDTTTPNWTDPTTATNAGATFVNGNNAVFAGTGATPSLTTSTNAGADAPAESYVVTLNSAITTGTQGTPGGILFNNTGFLLTSTTALTITDAVGLTVAVGKSASIGGLLTVNMSLASSSPSVTLGNGSVLNINTGATLTKSSNGVTRGLLLTTANAADSGTFNIAGTVSYNTPATTGNLVIGQTSGTTTVNVLNGGLLANNVATSAGTAGITLSNNGATSILNVATGGSVSAASGLQVGRLGSATVNLNGGTITTVRVNKAAAATILGTFNFNGGTLTANATNNTDFMTGLTRANVSAGGAVINTAGFDVTIGQALLQSNVALDAGTGGLTKNGAGTLTLTGANTYAGATTINTGTLTVGTGGTLGATTAPLAVNNPNAAAGTAVVLNLATAADTTTGSMSGTLATPSTGTNTATINNPTGRNFTVNQTTAGTFGGTIAGAGNLTLGALSTNTLTLTGVNTYTGTTAINAGTLAASATTGKALGGTTGIAINSGTLLLGAANQVNTATAVPITMGTATTTGILAAAAGANQGSAATVTGGAPAVGGPSVAGLGALTLANTSTLTYSGAATTLVFGVFNPAGKVLNITGYTNSTFAADSTSSGGAGDDRLVFSGTAGSVPATNFAFNGNAAGFGVTEIALDTGFYEVAFAAVPEPSTWVGGLLGLGIIGFAQRRRLSAAFQS